MDASFIAIRNFFLFHYEKPSFEINNRDYHKMIKYSFSTHFQFSSYHSQFVEFDDSENSNWLSLTNSLCEWYHSNIQNILFDMIDLLVTIFTKN